MTVLSIARHLWQMRTSVCSVQGTKDANALCGACFTLFIVVVCRLRQSFTDCVAVRARVVLHDAYRASGCSIANSIRLLIWSKASDIKRHPGILWQSF
jgi:hypothetical protein